MRPTMTFLMGLPGAGKSTVASAQFPGATFINPDAIKESHPDYDPNRAYLVHDWSMQMEEREFLRALAEQDGHYVIDGTGTNAEKLVRRMHQAKALGFTVNLLYVKVTLATSLRRAAARQRQVPVHVIREKALNIETSFCLIAPHADDVTVIDNDRDTIIPVP